MKKLMCAFAAIAVATACAAVVVAERGAASAYAIVLPDKPSPSENYAAEELRDHVKLLTGVELPIGDAGKRKVRIAIAKGFADDEFRIRADGADVVIEGGKRGVLYGVYELLETYGGIGWFSSWHTYVPRADVFAVPSDLDIRQKPAILLRMPYWRDVKGDFAARIRANGDFQQVGEKHGGAAFRFGGGLGVCHTFDRILPAKEHFAAHPEWYGYRAKKGKRCGEGRHAQLCLTNPEVLRIVTSNVLDRIRKDPGALCYGVSQNDSHEYCECETCRAVDEEEESHAGTMVRFVNAIAEAVEREFPGKIIETLAYEYTRKPPKKTKLRHNVMPCLCTSGVDFSVPIRESRHPGTQSFLADINGWGRQTRQLYIWDYTVNFRHYLHCFPNIFTLQGNLKLFRDNGVIGILAQGDYTGWHADFGELRAWLMAKWMWNPDSPAEPLLDRFFNGYYGKAAPAVRKAFDLVYGECAAAAANTNTPPLVMYADIEREPPSEKVMEQVERLWLEAETIAETDDPVCRYNVRMGAMGAYYTVAMRFAYVGYRKGWPFIYLTRDTAAHARLLRARTAARRTLERIGEAEAKGHKVILVEHWPAEWMGVLRNMANALDPQTERLVLPASRLKIQMTNACDVVAVPDAAGGKAVKFSNAGWHWAATFNMSGIKFDDDADYRIRLHVKVDLTGKADGEMAFSAGVHDRESKKSCGMVEIKAGQVKDGWAWYEVASLKPKRSQYLWIASGRFDKAKFSANPAVNAVYVDQVEISRVRSKSKGKEKFRMRAVFLDLGRQMETVDFITDYIDFIADSGHNALCLYFEGRLKTPTTQALPDAESYSKADIAAICAKAKTRGVEIIPSVEVLGHAGLFFCDGRLRHLSEERDGDGRWGGVARCDTFCPTLADSKEFIARYLSEVAAMFPESRLMMVGLDEPWNMGFCKLCRERRKTEGFGGIFARHVDFVHDVLAKAGKTMYMFDDFYEFFPERLAECPKDVWMSSWMYDRQVSRWGHRGHFAQRIRIDFLRRYRELGIKAVPACSTWFDYHNIRTLSEYAEAAGCEGMTFTHWGVDDRFYGQYAPVVAAAGAYWKDPDSFVAADFARIGLDRVFPKLTAAEKDAIAPALHMRLYMPQSSVEGTLNLDPRPDRMIAMEAAIAAFMRSAYAPGESIAPHQLSPEALADDFVCQLRLAVAREKLRLIGPELASPRRERSRVATARADLARVRDRLSAVAARRRMQHVAWRRGCVPNEMARHVEKAVSLCDRLLAMPECPSEDEWWLEVGLSMPEYHMSPHWIVKAEKHGEWRTIADGRWKAEMMDWANFEHVVPVRLDWRPARIRMEYCGHGPCSMNCVALWNRDVRLRPNSISKIEGLVRNPENLLVDNWKPAAFGWPDTMEVFHKPELGGIVSAVELELTDSVLPLMGNR